ncbi:MAG TPA: 3-dehydroquinate synthase [Rhizomicrobium sp.]|jgi:3-dehydroquinate synthase|nr:3-dehydroquinate synthase [Rhizomicrobium sp.]
MSRQIPVALGNRSYTIHVDRGLLGHAGELLAPFARGTVPVVTDANVAPLHLEPLSRSLHACGLAPRAIVLDPGESTKSFQGLERLIDALLNCGIDRHGLIVALGGGVIGDIAGFAAGILKRGTAYAQIPTTLLAQVDSSVGGKTAINTREGKNLVGVFHQPKIVIADTDVLRTLPRRELLAGYAEVVKYGALGDAAFFGWLEENARDALSGDAGKLEHMVARCCRIKAQIVGRDERETGERALLNLGHTFAHALEAATNYSDALLHGEAVAAGMVLAFRLSVQLGLAAAQDLQRLESHLISVGLPSSLAAIPGERPKADTLLSHMTHDKKATGGRLTFILVRGLGHAFSTNDVPIDAVRAVLG